MSKSLGNIVDPLLLIQELPSDSLRYFLLRTATIEENTNFSKELLIETCNADLANTLGNLLSRITAKSLNPKKSIPSLRKHDVETYFDAEDLEILESLENLPSKVKSEFESYHLRQGIAHIIHQLQLQNKFIERHKPWNLRHDDSLDHIHSVLAFSFEALRISAILLQPITPTICQNLLDQMNVSPNKRSLKDCHLVWDDVRYLQEGDVLYRRISTNSQ